MATRRRGCWLLALLVLGVGTAHAEDDSQQANETFDSARWLLERTTRVQDGQPKSVDLRALRQLHDPALRPLFLELTRRSHPVLQVHGILGLAELSENGLVDLARVSSLDRANVQAQLLSAAVDGDLISTEQARQVVKWTDVDPRVRLVAALKLVATGSAEKLPLLQKLTKSERPAVRGLAAMLRLQLGDTAAMRALKAIGRSDQAGRVQRMLLEQAIDHGLEKVGQWAIRLAKRAETPSSVAFLALRTCLKFDQDGAAEVWASRFDRSTAADRIRLASLAPDAADQLAAKEIRRLRAADSRLIRRLGEVTHALANGRPAVGPIMKLLMENHSLASKWVLQHAMDLPIRRARPLLVGIIYAAEWPPNPERFRSQRLERVVFATEEIVERAAHPGPLVRALVRHMPDLTAEAVVMGLIRSQAEAPHQLIKGIDDWPSTTARSMAVLLRAKHGASLDASEKERLALIVRGGAGLKSPLRVQAAWTYLKRTDQDKVAMARVLEN